MSNKAQQVNQVAIGTAFFLVFAIILGVVIHGWSEPSEAPEQSFAARVLGDNSATVPAADMENLSDKSLSQRALDEGSWPEEEAAQEADEWGDEDESWD